MNYVSNPTAPGARKPVSLLTDRAKRYRAQKALPESTPRICGYCGNPSTMRDHIDGNENHGGPDNLVEACRRCNVRKANVMRAAGIGKRTRQYNPDAKPAANLAQWTMAVASVLRRDKKTGRLLPPDNWKAQMMPVQEAVAMIRATPHADRVGFARELAAKRKGKPASWEVPF
jgi:hypothetical protein